MQTASTTFIFPGQGSQSVGMGKDLCDSFACAREVFEAASEAIGLSLTKLCFEGPADRLTLTENQQPAILTVSVAAWSVLEKETGARAQALAMAGHSLGEYSALVAAGALPLADAVKTVRARGEAMQRAVPQGQGKMAAILGLDPAQVEEICEKAAQAGEVAQPANFNAPGQIAVSGSAAAVERAMKLSGEAGGKALALDVSAPFHCPLMARAAEELKPVLAAAKFETPKVPVLRNVDAKPHGGPDQIREFLFRQVTAPVRWTDTVAELKKLGAQRFVEVGPGRVLGGLLKRIDRQAVFFNVENVATLKKFTGEAAA